MNVFVYNRINRIGKDVGDMRETRILEFQGNDYKYFFETVSAFRIMMEEPLSLGLMTMERSKG